MPWLARFGTLVFSLLILAGCTHTNRLDVATPEDRAAINERAAGAQTTLEFRDGQRLRVEALHVGSDSTSWREVKSGHVGSVATANISTVSFAANRIGEGLGIGFFGGAAVGYVVGYSTFDRPNIVVQNRGSNAVGGTLLFAGLGALVGVLAGADSENEDVFLFHAESAPYEETWSEILGRIVTDDGLVRYDLLDGPQRDDFDAVIEAVETFDASALTTDAEKLAFWMNAYNAKMIERVLAAGVPANIEAHGFDFFFKTPVRVASRDLTLDQIEHGILRRQDETLVTLQPSVLDPRLHVGLNCGAISCPRLRQRAFTAANLDAELDRAMRDFVNSPRHFRFDGDTAVLSSLLDWFGDDFDSTGESAGDYLLGYMDADRLNADRLQELFAGRTAAEIKAQPDVRFEYRWDLNAAGG